MWPFMQAGRLVPEKRTGHHQTTNKSILETYMRRTKMMAARGLIARIDQGVAVEPRRVKVRIPTAEESERPICAGHKKTTKPLGWRYFCWLRGQASCASVG